MRRIEVSSQIRKVSTFLPQLAYHLLVQKICIIETLLLPYHVSETLATTSDSKRKHGQRGKSMVHGLHDYTRSHGGNKMKIEFTEGVRRPKDHIQAAKLSFVVGIQFRDKMPLVTK
jgi:hypothetical protein